jgi:MoxR-like ATPase
MGDSTETIRRLEENVGRALFGKPEVVRLAIIGLVARGHLLIEDVPGVGKTTLASGLARSIGASFQRIQFTSDMLPWTCWASLGAQAREFVFAGPALHQYRARRRDQPHHAEDAVRAGRP